jgi:hypothetical protein
MDSCPLCRSAGGGGGGTRGVMKSPLFPTDLLGADGRLLARGGMASKLLRTGGDSSPFERALSRDTILCASINELGMEDADSWRPCDGLSDVATVVGVGGSGDERMELCFIEDAASESPRAGLSWNLGSEGACAEGCPSFRLGSSNGLIPD